MNHIDAVGVEARCLGNNTSTNTTVAVNSAGITLAPFGARCTFSEFHFYSFDGTYNSWLQVVASTYFFPAPNKMTIIIENSMTELATPSSSDLAYALGNGSNSRAEVVNVNLIFRNLNVGSTWNPFTATNVGTQWYLSNATVSVEQSLSGNDGVDASVITPTVPASATAYTNSFFEAVRVYAYGGAVTEVQITRANNGTTYTVFSASTATALSGQPYDLGNGDSITITYTTAPTWEWMPARSQ